MSEEDVLSLYKKPPHLLKFKVVGLLPSPQFQKCRYLTQRLHSTFPKIYAVPEIKGLLNFDWDEYLTKMRRQYGIKYYLVEGPVHVFLDDELIGNDQVLTSYIERKYLIEIDKDFDEIAECETAKYLENIIEHKERKFAYLVIIVDDNVVGSMLFMLYNDLVPNTCDNFLRRCTDKTPRFTYKDTKIHRIAAYSWIQFGGGDLIHYQQPCENYTIPHDRRGVLSMCNTKRHQNNSTQFFVTLNPAAWMDYNYVAFGQLVQGGEILNLLEKIPTYYEAPLKRAMIVDCGEFVLNAEMDVEQLQALNVSYDNLFKAVSDDDIDSILKDEKYRARKYCLKTDLFSYLPFARYSTMFDYIEKLDTGYDEMLEHDHHLYQVVKGVEEYKAARAKTARSSKHFYLRARLSR